MLLKKLLLSTVICLNTVIHLCAQGQRQFFYIKAGVEYAIPILTTNGFEGNTDFSINPPSGGGQYVITGTTAKKTSFGNGLWASLQVGYFFVENIGVDIGVQMGIQQPEKEYTYTRGSNQITSRIINKANHPLFFNPSIIYRIPIKNHLLFLGKAGIVLPFSTRIIQEEYRISDTYLTSEITNRFALGFSCGLAAEYQIAQHLSLAADVNMVALSVDSKKKVMTSFNADGKELIAEVPDNIRITNYEYNVKYTGLSTNITEPISTPFSRLGISLGVSYYF